MLAGLGVAASMLAVRVDSKGQSTRVFQARKKFTVEEESVRRVSHNEARKVIFPTRFNNLPAMIRGSF